MFFYNKKKALKAFGLEIILSTFRTHWSKARKFASLRKKDIFTLMCN